MAVNQSYLAFIDTYGNDVSIIVTGSARLDIYKRGGDSLMGRYFPYRMHPISVAECLRTNLLDTEISLQFCFGHGGNVRSVSIEHATALAKFRQRQIDLLGSADQAKLMAKALNDELDIGQLKNPTQEDRKLLDTVPGRDGLYYIQQNKQDKAQDDYGDVI